MQKLELYKNAVEYFRKPEPDVSVEKLTEEEVFGKHIPIISKAWMETAFSKMGDKMPDSFTIHLPCYLNYRTLYAYMEEDLTIAGENELIAYSQFCKLMHTDFNQVTIPKVTFLFHS